MGITLLQKSGLKAEKKGAKKALVLAGGALTGASFKIGGLKALNDYFVNFDIRKFDIFLGISSGSLLATALSGGLSPEEMLKSLAGTSKKFSKLQPWHFYWPNWEEFIFRPFRFWKKAGTWLPNLLLGFLSKGEADVDFPSLLEMLPSGIFDNEPIERYLRENIRRNRMTNDFKKARLKSGKSLYITAMTLDAAQETVFGYDERNDVTISKAGQASSAMPGFYKPVKIGDHYYVDGGVKHTANLDLMVKKGAGLIVCYNPFRPFESGEFAEELEKRKFKKRNSLTQDGIFAILNQFFRTVFHTRLHNALQMFERDPDFVGDIILIEPRADDEAFFSMNPFSLGHKLMAAKMGFDSVRESIEENYKTLAKVLAGHGIEISRRHVEAESRDLDFGLEKILEAR